MYTNASLESLTDQWEADGFHQSPDALADILGRLGDAGWAISPPGPNTTNPLAALIREMIDDEPISSCAEDGSSCALCGAEWNQALAQFGDGQGMIHTPDCWINRARAALGICNE